MIDIAVDKTILNWNVNPAKKLIGDLHLIDLGNKINQIIMCHNNNNNNGYKCKHNKKCGCLLRVKENRIITYNKITYS